jgi:hypothetical protein
LYFSPLFHSCFIFIWFYFIIYFYSHHSLFYASPPTLYSLPLSIFLSFCLLHPILSLSRFLSFNSFLYFPFLSASFTSFNSLSPSSFIPLLFLPSSYFYVTCSLSLLAVVVAKSQERATVFSITMPDNQVEAEVVQQCNLAALSPWARQTVTQQCSRLNASIMPVCFLVNRADSAASKEKRRDA